MRRLADPKDLLLNFSHSLETDLDPKIASGYHYGGHRSSHCGKQNPREVFNRAAVLDFENDSSLLRFKAVEFGNQLCHVFGTPNEREGDHISVLGSKFKVFAILGRQGRNIELRIRQVNTLLGTKFGAAIGGLGNFYFRAGVRGLLCAPHE